MTSKATIRVGNGPEIDMDDVDAVTGEITKLIRASKETVDEPLSSEIAVETIDLAADTLSGDLRDAVLDLFKHRKKPWEEMGEADQRDTLAHIESVTGRLVGRACLMLAAGGRLTASAALETFKQKGRDLDATLKLYAEDRTVTALSHACGSTVQIVFVDAAQFKGERAPVEIEKDQGSIFDATPQGADLAAAA